MVIKQQETKQLNRSRNGQGQGQGKEQVQEGNDIQVRTQQWLIAGAGKRRRGEKGRRLITD